MKKSPSSVLLQKKSDLKPRGDKKQRSRLLPSKLAWPVPQEWHLVRQDTLQVLDAALGIRLTILQAPAGYGKSSCLAQWIEVLNRRGIRVAWLLLEETDREPIRLLTYLLAAIEARTDHAIEQKFSESRGEAAVERMLHHLAATLFDFDGELVVILDDFHLCETSDTSRLVDRLIRNLSDSAHFVIATREAPLLQAGALRAAGDLLEMGIPELRFSSDETHRFLSKQLAEQPTPELSNRLWEITEGWPLAIQLACLWLASADVEVSSITEFSGRNKDITDYLQEQVLRALPMDVQQFLLELSVLDQFSGDIANYVCQREDSWQVIERLAKQNLFVIRADNEGRWHRFHSLFAEFLFEQFERKDSQRIELLRIRAADWYARNGMLTEAIRSFVLAGSAGEAAKLIERDGGWRLLYSAHTGVLRDFFRGVDRSMLLRFPRLHLAQICVLIKSGQMELAEQSLNAWDIAAADLPDDPLLATDRKFVGALWLDYRDVPWTSNDIEELRQTIEAADHGDHLLKGMLHHQLCTSCFELCLFDAAREAAETAKQYLLADGYDYATYTLDLCIGQIAQSRGDQQQAVRSFEEAIRSIHKDHGDDGDAVCILRIALASALYAQNEVARAKRLLESALEHAERFDGWYSVYVAGYETAAGIAAQERGASAALNTWRRAREIGDKRRLWKLSLHAEYRRMQIHLEQGDLRNARTLSIRLKNAMAERDAIDQSMSNTVPMRHLRGETKARSAMAVSDGTRAREMLKPMLDSAMELGWVTQQIRLLLLDARACYLDGKLKSRNQQMLHALNAAASGNNYRLFLDQGREILDFIGELLERGALAGMTMRFARSILSADVLQSGNPRMSAASNLGQRELQTLRLLSDGLSNKQIAFKLGISSSTVKFHRKNLYKKLNVHNRAAALEAARRLELLHTHRLPIR